MSFYSLPKQNRVDLIEVIKNAIFEELHSDNFTKTLSYFSDEDTYIRKSVYLLVGRIYFENKNLRIKILALLDELLQHPDFKVRQTTINTAGEIGKKDFEAVTLIFDKGLFDVHHSPRNAVIGSLKKMVEVNPVPVLMWAEKYLLHKNAEIRREVCHGLELRGRKYPQDILPLLKKLQFEKTARVRNMLIHVLGQIAYKKGCLQIVIGDLKTWDNKQLVIEALDEIIDVHDRYHSFSALTQNQAMQYIAENMSEINVQLI